MAGWQREVFDNFKLYAVTDIQTPDLAILDKINAAYEGGADIVQLRSKMLQDEELRPLGQEIRKIANKHQKLYFVNDSLDLALATQADGLHIGQDDISVPEVRKHSKNILLGKSTHSFEQASRATQEDVDYIGVGPIYSTPTKPGTQSVGLNLIKQVADRLQTPFVCIGGIHHNNVKEVLRAGATRIAVVRAIFAAENVYESTRKLREIIDHAETVNH